MWDGREFHPEFYLWSTRMYSYTFVSGSEKFKNKTGLAVRQFFRMQSSLSLTMISYGRTHRLGFVISYTTTGSPLALLLRSPCYQHDPYTTFLCSWWKGQLGLWEHVLSALLGHPRRSGCDTHGMGSLWPCWLLPFSVFKGLLWGWGAPETGSCSRLAI